MKIIILQDGNEGLFAFKDLNALRNQIQKWYGNEKDISYIISETDGIIYFITTAEEDFDCYGNKYKCEKTWTNRFWYVEVIE